jgi:hypothetical protein
VQRREYVCACLCVCACVFVDVCVYVLGILFAFVLLLTLVNSRHISLCAGQTPMDAETMHVILLIVCSNCLLKSVDL